MNINLKNNLEYYKIFYYVAQCGSFTKAAQILCISQPAISQSIKLLEENLEVCLFVRTPKGVRLTMEGEVLYSYIKKGYETIVLGEETLRKMLDFESGEIRIGASDMTLKFYLLPYLERFHMKYPKIKVIVTNAPTPETIRYLDDGRIDFGIVSEPFEDRFDLEILKVRKIEDIFVAGNRYLEFRNRTVDYNELIGMSMICLEQNTSTRVYMDRFLSENKIALMPEFELATSDMIVQFALRNLGIGCVVKDFALEKLEQKELFEIQFNKKIPKRNICMIQKKKTPLSRAAKKLLDTILESGSN